SAALNRRSSRGSIFLKLNWSVASSNSSGLAKRKGLMVVLEAFIVFVRLPAQFWRCTITLQQHPHTKPAKSTWVCTQDTESTYTPHSSDFGQSCPFPEERMQPNRDFLPPYAPPITVSIPEMVDQFWLRKQCLPLGCSVAPVPFSPCSWSYQSQMLRSSTTLCPPCLSSRRMVPREEDDKRLCLLLLTDLDDLTPAPHCSNRQHKMLT
ncbi:hypothetical protein INR49_012367, partial [Caranx melampygus]